MIRDVMVIWGSILNYNLYIATLFFYVYEL